MYVCMLAIHSHNPAPTNLRFHTLTRKDTESWSGQGFFPTPLLNVLKKPKRHFKRHELCHYLHYVTQHTFHRCPVVVVTGCATSLQNIHFLKKFCIHYQVGQHLVHLLVLCIFMYVAQFLLRACRRVTSCCYNPTFWVDSPSPSPSACFRRSQPHGFQPQVSMLSTVSSNQINLATHQVRSQLRWITEKYFITPNLNVNEVPSSSSF